MNHAALNTRSAAPQPTPDAMRELVAAMPIVILVNALRAALQRPGRRTGPALGTFAH